MARRSHAATLALVLALAMALAACGGDDPEPAAGVVVPDVLGDDAVTIASFDFPESELLAELYGHALRAVGVPVRLELRLGARELVAPAMAAGLVELVPEYLGTALRFQSLGEGTSTTDVAAAHAALVEALAPTPVRALAPADAQDANAFVVTRATATRHRLRTLSDLAPVAGQLTFGGPPECRTRPLCLGGLQGVYGLRFAGFLPLDAGGPVTRQALAAGQVDVALLFSTDPAIDGVRLFALRDDRGLQPAENVTPLVREEVLDRWGDQLVRAVDAVSSRLTTDVLRSLNREVQRGTEPVATTAARWLAEEGLVR